MRRIVRINIRMFWRKISGAALAARAAALVALFVFCTAEGAQRKSLVFVAGNSVHLWGDHENLAFCKTLEKLARGVLKNTDIRIVDVGNGGKLSEVGSPDAVVIIGEGEGNHPLAGDEAFLKRMRLAGTNVGVFHYALHFSDAKNYAYLDDSVGGHYEPHWSVNPFWRADFKVSDSHPIARGVRPFSIDDEWYFNIKFAAGDARRIVPVLTAAPPDRVRNRGFGPHSGNPHVRSNKGREETILWTIETADGARGLGFCGGHSVWALADPNFRKVLVNSLAWLAEEDIPPGGFNTPQPDYGEIAAMIKKEKRRDYEDYSARWKKFFEDNK